MQELRLAIRALRAAPVVSFVAIMSLALGIGANTAIFSLVNSLLVRTLPVSEPDRLVTVSSVRMSSRGAPAAWPDAVWNEIRRRSDMFDGAFAWSAERLNLAESGETQPVEALFISGNAFAELGVRTFLGRAFTEADDVPNGGPSGPVVLISHGFWQYRFGGSSDAIGRKLAVEGAPFTIIGVTSVEFFGLEVGRRFDIVLPVNAEPIVRGTSSRLPDRQTYWLNIMLRLRPDQSVDAATAALRTVQPQIRDAAMPRSPLPRVRDTFLKDPFVAVAAAVGTSSLRQRYERPLLATFGAAALVLLVASANLANLLLAGVAARRHEFTVRVALGAPRWSIARQVIVESLVMAGCGTAAGLLLARWASSAVIRQLSTPGNQVFLDLSLDWRVAGFTSAVMVLTALLFGLVPAARATRVALFEVLHEHGQAGGGHGRFRLSPLLVSGQLALSLVLIVAAGLFVGTFQRLSSVPLGFDAERVVIVDVTAAGASINSDYRTALYNRLVAAVATVPRVQHAAGSVVVPFTGGGLVLPMQVPNATPTPATETPVMVNFVTPGWLATFGVRIRSGRDIQGYDGRTSHAVAVVNETFARTFFPGDETVGRTITYGGPLRGLKAAPRTIIGVAGDVLYGSPREPVQPTVYLPLAQWDIPRPMDDVRISVRAVDDSPAALIHSISAAITSEDRSVDLTFRTLSSHVDAALTQERLTAILAGFFGVLALVLAALGLYGLTSYSVDRQRREIGIRMALGSTQGRIVRLVFMRTCSIVGAGVVAGIVLSLWLARFVAKLLYGLEPADPMTLCVAVATLACVSIAATWVPTYRASRLAPSDVLREH